jgi:Dyp-type peroxidase family
VVNAGPEDRAAVALVERLVSTVFQGGDTAALDGLLGTGAARESCDRVLGLSSALPGGRLALDDLFGADGAVASRLTLSGVAAGGGSVRLPVFGVYRIADARIAEAFHGWDDLDLRAQLDSGPGEPVLALDDIQGNVFPGFAKDQVAVLGLRMHGVPAARAALAVLAAEVATAAEVWAFGRLFAETRARRGHEGAVQACWANAALSYPALLALAPDAELFADEAFRATAAGPRPADLLLVIAGDDEADVGRETRRLTAALAPGFTVVGEQFGAALPGELRGHEHFGFRDGISQPGVRGRHPESPHQPVTARHDPADPDHGKPGQALVWPGEFIFGYSGEGDPAGGAGPVVEAGPDWARHGSFLVYGRYRQDVAAFQRFAATAGRALPDPAGLDPRRLAALVVGRWPSGAALVAAPDHDDPALGADDDAVNDFVYRAEGPHAPADPGGLRCPYAAHIRKANIRDDLDAIAGPGAARRHRILRRGIPYGPPGADRRDRGLLFLSYQTSIVRQFEFVLDGWLDNGSLRVPGEGVDLIAGRSTLPRAFGIPVAGDGSPRIVTVRADEPFTELTDGGYFFAPGLAGLRRLAGAG